MAYYVYLVRCEDGSLYGGITTDPLRRLVEHKTGAGAKYTRAHGAKYMEKIWSAEDRAAASRLEYAVKKLPKAKKEALVQGAALSEVGIEGEYLDCGGREYPDRLDRAKAYFQKNDLRTKDIAQSVLLGIAVVVDASEKGVLVYLPYSKFYALCADDQETTARFAKEMTEPWDMVVTHHIHEEDVLAAIFPLSPMERVCNAVYEKKTPPVIQTDAVVRPMEKEHLPFVLSVYSLYDAEEDLLDNVRRGSLLGAFVDGEPVGFVGLHAEGAMGMLEVLPSHRQKGYGTALVAAQVSRLLAQKRLPFGQIFASNAPSLSMQKKLGFSFSKPEIRWFYRK